jgi:hypothetical protein
VMNYRKVTLEDLNVFKKRRVQYLCYEVASQVEEFDCGASCSYVYKNLPHFGISKQEHKVSGRFLVHSFLAAVGCGS